jgi:16S rRNA (uracil1498-N3)-methyltransferase
MTPPLFLVDTLPHGDLVVLDGDEGRHAHRVKRLTVGERVLVGDGRGTVLSCRVTATSADDRLCLQVLDRRTEPCPDPRLVVLQALPKADRAELAVEALTELGADEIVPWSAHRSVGQWRDARGAKALAKWRRTAREATKQSRRSWAPCVAELATSSDVTGRIRASAGALVLHEAATESLATAPLPDSGDVVVVVGPEGGLSPDELATFAAAGGQLVRLGTPVLRTATAGAAALAAISVRVGRWN